MRFYNISGLLQRARRAVSKPASISAEDVKDPQRLGDILRSLSVRVQELEAKQAPEAVEFVKNITGNITVPTSGTIRMTHNFGVPVRFYPVWWSGSTQYPPILVYSTASDLNTLVLTTYSTGTVIVRIEPSSYGYT